MTKVLPFFASLFIIGLAELGDKTQLFPITLASKYPIEKVIYGVFSATAALMLIAVFAGELIQEYISKLLISILAGAFFIIYGLMIIRPVREEKEHEEKEIKSKNPFWAVFGSFFLAELGDKTQLATFALAAKYGAPIQVWIGATAGMAIVNLLGIAIGNIIKKFLHEKIINYVSGGIFIIFGLITFLSIFSKV